MPPKPTAKPLGNRTDRRADGSDYPLTGETLGLWRLVKGIGRGGMGEVYEAEYDYLHVLTLSYAADERPRLRRELHELSREEQARLASEMIGSPLPPDARFAVKVCSARAGTAGHRRFIQEAELAKRLGDHPYVVTVHAIHAGLDGSSTLPIDGGKHRDVPFMVMDLARREYDHNKLSIPQAVQVIRAIATALDHSHKHGVVHRDLKPENFLGSVDHPLLTDFGIAKEIDHTLGLTRTGQIIGTLDYMSPEQATDAKSVDLRSDIYSLGVVLYEFATGGQLPYVHLAEREACLAAIRSPSNSGKWPRDHAADFPRSLERIILKATAHRPEDRYQSMSELILDLDKFMRGEWISPFGRIRLRRYLLFLRERHPRVVYGIPVALGLVLAAWIAFNLPAWLDTKRREFDERLHRLQTTVEAIERRDPGQQQLPPEQRTSLARMQTELSSLASDRYRQHQQRLDELMSRLRRSRYLSVDLTSPRAAAHDQEQLRWAGRVGDSPDWTLSEQGLLILGNSVLTFEGYGQGLAYVYLSVLNADGLRLTITESSDQRHRTVLAVNGPESTLSLQQDEQPPQILWRGRSAQSRELAIGLEVSEQGIRAWLPQMHIPTRDPALRTGAPAQVVLNLPQGAVLRHLQIWPEGPE
ncbi:MAG: hypothetical protein EA402_07020 [Planctomycetota bacterium]|nr:MAG: hypothetical protein EA402_07020 [Planctomycetota bacterium]